MNELVTKIGSFDDNAVYFSLNSSFLPVVILVATFSRHSRFLFVTK